MRRRRSGEGYDTSTSAVATLPCVIFGLGPFSEATLKTAGLIATFGGIGVVVNLLIVYALIQVRGEHRQNQEYLASRRPPA